MTAAEQEDFDRALAAEEAIYLELHRQARGLGGAELDALAAAVVATLALRRQQSPADFLKEWLDEENDERKMQLYFFVETPAELHQLAQEPLVFGDAELYAAFQDGRQLLRLIGVSLWEQARRAGCSFEEQIAKRAAFELDGEAWEEKAEEMTYREADVRMRRQMIDVQHAIEKDGWYSVAVSGSDEGPGFLYTIGLHRNYGAPELILFGLDPTIMHAFVRSFKAKLETGERFAAGQETTLPMATEGGELRIAFRDVPEEQVTERLRFADAFYGEEPFEVLQLVWPDVDGKLPWEEGCDVDVRTYQPLLGELGG